MGDVVNRTKRSGVGSGSHAPHSTRSSLTHRSTNASTNEVLPAPDSPDTKTMPPRPARASSALAKISPS